MIVVSARASSRLDRCDYSLSISQGEDALHRIFFGEINDHIGPVGRAWEKFTVTRSALSSARAFSTGVVSVSPGHCRFRRPF